MKPILIYFLVRLSCTCSETIIPDNNNLIYEGRYGPNIIESKYIDFDQPGFKIIFAVEGTTKVDLLLTSKGVNQPHRFWIYVDDALTSVIIDTFNASINEVTKYNVASNLSPDYHDISIVKIVRQNSF